MATEADPLLDAEDLGVAAELLLEQGKVQAAALLTDAKHGGLFFVEIAKLDDGTTIGIFDMALDVPVLTCRC